MASGTNMKFVQIKGFNIPEFLVDKLTGFEEVEVRSSDIWVCSFPKSGTTWTQEIVYLLVNDCKFELAKSATLDDRSPFLESPTRIKPISEFPSPRVIMTHTPFVFLPRDVREGKCKIVYVMRNPRDVTVSSHHFMKGFALVSDVGSFSEYAQQMLEGKVFCGPYWTHLQQFWEQRHRPNVYINTFEQMKYDLPGTVRALAKFLDKKLTEEHVAQMVKWCSFSEMKNNPMTNKTWDSNIQATFMRKGIVGDWKSHMTPELSMQFDAMYDKHLKPLGITFDLGDDQ